MWQPRPAQRRTGGIASRHRQRDPASALPDPSQHTRTSTELTFATPACVAAGLTASTLSGSRTLVARTLPATPDLSSARPGPRQSGRCRTPRHPRTSKALMFAHTLLANIELSGAKGLDSTVDGGSISTSAFGTLSSLERKDSRTFSEWLRPRCQEFDRIPSFANRPAPGRYGSIPYFISFWPTKDEDFAKRLPSKMLDAGLCVWFAPEDVQGGRSCHGLRR